VVPIKGVLVVLVLVVLVLAVVVLVLIVLVLEHYLAKVLLHIQRIEADPEVAPVYQKRTVPGPLQQHLVHTAEQYRQFDQYQQYMQYQKWQAK
jgi:hypothetical protein